MIRCKICRGSSCVPCRHFNKTIFGCCTPILTNIKIKDTNLCLFWNSTVISYKLQYGFKVFKMVCLCGYCVVFHPNASSSLLKASICQQIYNQELVWGRFFFPQTFIMLSFRQYTQKLHILPPPQIKLHHPPPKKRGQISWFQTRISRILANLKVNIC